jgi:predicted transcriptional regulator
MTNKAIIGLESWGAMQARAIEIARRVDAGEAVPEADYHLNFATAAQLFNELTPARLALLEVLKGLGAVSIYALAKHLGRNYRNVHTDISKLLELGLVEKNEAGKVWVPWDEVQIRVTLGGAAAA